MLISTDNPVGAAVAPKRGVPVELLPVVTVFVALTVLEEVALIVDTPAGVTRLAPVNATPRFALFPRKILQLIPI